MYDSYQELEHFGVKGMKWGIRRTPVQLGHKKVKKQRTTEQQAKFEARKRKAIKAAKIGASVLAIASGAAAADFAFNSAAGLRAAGALSLNVAYNSATAVKNIRKGAAFLQRALVSEMETRIDDLEYGIWYDYQKMRNPTGEFRGFRGLRV